MKTDYYSQKLAAQELQQCYKIAPPRVKQYLDAEIEYVQSKIKPSNLVMELGCGYGRVLQKLATRVNNIIGIDTSYISLVLAGKLLNKFPQCQFFQMNAIQLGFKEQVFDVVFCIQNGISAFNVDQQKLIMEAVRVTRNGGVVFFSSYAQRCWKHRLEWFQLQAEHGLIGEIDYNATGDGIIVCKDGFRATTVTPEKFNQLALNLKLSSTVSEVDGSSVFFEVKRK